MKITKEARRTSRQLFRACMADGKLDESRVRIVVSWRGQKQAARLTSASWMPSPASWRTKWTASVPLSKAPAL
jgi:hypothetical protein